MSDSQVYLPLAAGLFGLSAAGRRAVHRRFERVPDDRSARMGEAIAPPRSDPEDASSPEQAHCAAEGSSSC